MAYSNSPLVVYKKLSPNHSGARKYDITRITPHCVVGQLSVESLGNIFAPTSRQASCQYGIGSDGRVGMYVEEKNRAWTSSSYDNDNRAITIECSSDLTHPHAFNETVWNKLIDLCTDICKRNGKKKLLWLGGKEATLSYKQKSDEMVLTAHRWFGSTVCPGDWMYAHEAELAKKVTERLKGTSSGQNTATPINNTPTTQKPATSPQTKPKKDLLTVDGYWGQLTTRRLQTALGTFVDGFISGQAAGSRKYHVNCERTTFKYGKGGSQCIRALQKLLGVTQDGHFGPGTIKALQKYLGLTQDGYCGPNTVKALQTWLNKLP